jgi:YYY domain-containing protein
VSETIRWLLVVEVLGVALLPLTTWFLGALPDRGFGLSKVVGILGVTYVVWIVGSVVPVAGSPLLPALILIIVAVLAWWRRGRQTLDAARQLGLLLLGEEALFLAAFLVWTILRAQVFHPAIMHTEQYMDMMLLNTSVRSPSYPPVDLWMSGHTVNYYYFGYLMQAVVAKLSDVSAAAAYNLALSLVFALTVSGAFTVGFALIRRILWAALAPLFVALLGNLHAAIVQVPHGQMPTSPDVTWWFFDSSRVVGNAADFTINEFPFFSFILGDLHPHVMALPVVLLALAATIQVVASRDGLPIKPSVGAIGRILAFALILGSLYTINSWDLPTYSLLAAAGIACTWYLWGETRRWWRDAPASILALAVCTFVLFLPFYLHFHSLAHGVGPVTTRSDPWQFLQVFGLFLGCAVFLVCCLGWLLQPSEVEASLANALESEAGHARAGAAASDIWIVGVALLICLALGIAFHALTLVLILILGAGGLIVLDRVLNAEEPVPGDVLALLFVLTACAVLAFTEVAYVRDSFDGGADYRMNTVFKFYYQAWVLLGLAGAHSLWRGFGILRRFRARLLAAGTAMAFGAGVIGAGVYTVLAPFSPPNPAYGAPSLDGSQWLTSARPGDAAAIQWLRQHAPEGSVELEAAGTRDYDTTMSRIATFTGLPTVMGWAGHEEQWRPGNAEIASRLDDVRTMYTGTTSRVVPLLHKYHVRYVVVGDTERTAYAAGGTHLTHFARFMRIAFSAHGTTVYSW